MLAFREALLNTGLFRANIQLLMWKVRKLKNSKPQNFSEHEKA